MESAGTCQICLNDCGVTRHLSRESILHADLENNLNIKLLPSVTTLSLCFKCCNLIGLWDVFATRARKNLTSFTESSSKDASNQRGIALSNEVMQLTQALEVVDKDTQQHATHSTQELEDSNEVVVKQEKEVLSDSSCQVEDDSHCQNFDIQWVIKSEKENSVPVVVTNAEHAVRKCYVALNSSEVEDYLKLQHEQHEIAAQEPREEDNNHISRSQGDDDSLSSDDMDNTETQAASFIDEICADDEETCLAPSPTPSFASVTSVTNPHNQLDPLTSQENTTFEFCDVRSSSDLELQGDTTYKVSEIKKHEQSKEYMCKICCNRKFTSKCHLVTHILSKLHKQNLIEWSNTNNSDANAAHQCEYCSKIFSNYFQMDSHFVTCLRGRIVESTMKRKVAKLAFENKKMKPEKCVETIVYECNFCSKTFNDKSMLERHARYHVRDINLSENSQHSTEEHTSSGNTSDDSDFKKVKSINCHKCHACPFQTNKKYNLQRHLLRMHKNVMPDIKTDERPSNLQSSTSELLTTKCNFCTFEASDNEDIKSHLLTLHGISNTPLIHSTSSSKRFQCSNCQFTTNKKYNLKIHELRFHTGVKKDPNNGEKVKSKPYNSELLKCRNCSFVTKMNVSLKHHTLRYHTGDYSAPSNNEKQKSKSNKSELFKCNSCSFVTKTHYNLKRHLLRIHLEKISSITAEKTSKSAKLFQCNICSVKTTTRFNMKRHIRRTHESSLVPTTLHSRKCLHCAQYFSNMYQFRLHAASHENSQVPKFECSSCSKSYLYLHEYKSHLKRAHADFICEICAAPFISEKLVSSHKYQVHDGLNYNCELCDIFLPDLQALRDHVFAQHVEPSLIENYSYDCDFCPEVFKTEQELETHVQSHHSMHGMQNDDIESELAGLFSDERPGSLKMPCSECGESFFALSLLYQHYRTRHPHATDITCKLCEPESKQLAYWRVYITHMKKVHFLKTGGKYKCPCCLRHYATQEYLLDHFGGSLLPGMDINNCIIPLTEEKRNQLACDICENVYTSWTGLWKHKTNYHPESQKFPCNDCKKMFFYECKLKKHRSETHDKILFPCDYCEEVTETKFQLTKHVIEFHKDLPAFVCKVCNIEFATARILNTHQKRHNDNRFVTYAAASIKQGSSSSNELQSLCDDTNCILTFPDNRQQGIHNITVHIRTACYACTMCDKIYTSIKSVVNHIKSIHDENKKKRKQIRSYKIRPNASIVEKKYKCGICDRDFNQVNTYSKHLASHKNDKLCSNCGTLINGEKYEDHYVKCQQTKFKFACKLCPKKSKTKALSKTHMLNHKMMWATLLPCSHCSLSFHTLDSLMYHYLSTHYGLKPLPLQCKYCDFNCLLTPELRSHIVLHDRKVVHCEQCKEDVQLTTYTHSHVLSCSDCCQVCGFVPQNQLSLLSHAAQHKVMPLNSCDMCSNNFPSDQNLEIHKKNCHGSYTCHFCDTNFSYKPSLATHIKRHLKVKASCKFCGRDFLSKLFYQKHMASYHSKNIPENIMAIVNTLWRKRH